MDSYKTKNYYMFKKNSKLNFKSGNFKKINMINLCVSVRMCINMISVMKVTPYFLKVK